MERNEMRKRVKKQLDKNRYEHTLGVMYTAASLAMAYGYPMEDAMTAGLLHDCAKNIPDEEKLKICKKHHIPVNSTEQERPCLLHAKLGAFLAKTEYGIKNQSILHAIEVHTTGEPKMSILDQIIYIADYIEPMRDKAPDLDEIRRLAFIDLNRCVARILRDTLTYLHEKGGKIDPGTQRTYDYYRQFEEKTNCH